MTYASFPVSGGAGDVLGPGISTDNGVVLWDGTSGTALKDLGVGSANQVLKTDGTTPSFGLIVNANVDASAAIAYSKLTLTGSIVNADINASAAIAYSKLASLTGSRVVVTSAGGVIEVSSITTTNLNTLSGSTANIASSLLGKLNNSGDEILTPGTLEIQKFINQAGVGSSNQLLRLTNLNNSGTDDAGLIVWESDLSNQYPRACIGGQSDGGASGKLIFGTVNTGGTMVLRLTIGNDGTATFANDVEIQATSNQLVLGTTNTTTISATAPSSSLTYTIPDVGGAADFVLTAGNQTIGGTKTFSSTISGSIDGNAATVTNGAYVNAANTFTLAQTISAASNQIVLSSGVSQLTLNSGTSAAARTYTVPDVGTTADFVMTAGAQTIGGAKTFSDNAFFSSNVSIGTTATPNIFTVQSGADFEGFQLNDQDGNRIARLIQNDDSGTNCVTFDMFASGGSSTIVNRISSRTGIPTYFNAGNVGIGTPIPGAPLHVSTTAGRIWLTDTSGGTDDKTAALLVSGGVFEINSRNDDGSTRVDNIFQADLGTGAVTLGPSTISGGIDHDVYVSDGSFTGRIVNRYTGTLANSQSVLFEVREGSTIKANIGAFKNASESADNGYIGLRTITGSFYFLWVDDTGDLRISNSSAAIGRGAGFGTVVGTQT